MLANLFSPLPHRPELLVWVSCWRVSTRVWLCEGSAKQISLVSVFRICSLTMQIQTPLNGTWYLASPSFHSVWISLQNCCSSCFRNHTSVLKFGFLSSHNSGFLTQMQKDFSPPPPPPPQAIWLQLTLDFLSTLIFHENKSFLSRAFTTTNSQKKSVELFWPFLGRDFCYQIGLSRYREDLVMTRWR